MTLRQPKGQRSVRDHLTAYLVLLVIVGVIALGGVTLVMTGVFNPVEIKTPLEGTKPLEFETPMPRSFLQWLFPTASAEAETPADQEEMPAAQDDAAIPSTEDELETLLQQIVAEELGETEITDADRVTVGRDDLSINANLPDDIYNVLLMATDNRDMNATTGRTDVMIIGSLNMKTSEIKLTSLSRDLYVTIPGVGQNKLNAAYAYGGEWLALKTINENFELNIKDFAVVNFSAMASIIDTLGGIDIYLEPMEYYYINYNVAVSEDFEGFPKNDARKPLTEEHQEVMVHLDGLQGVSYARIRKMDNDLQRGSRQRILLSAMMDKALTNASPAKIFSLADTISRSLYSNVQLTTLIDVGLWFLEGDGEFTMEEMTIPIPGSYHSAREKEMEVISFSQRTNTEALHEFLYGQYIPAAGQ